MWAFKTLYDKGLVYEGFRVLPYCWRVRDAAVQPRDCGWTTIYQQRQDPAVTVWVELETGERLLVWTTTPWTLPSQPGAAPSARTSTTSCVEHDGERYLLGRGRGSAPTRGSWRGRADRVGHASRAPSSSAAATPRRSTSSPTGAGTERATRCSPRDYVTTEDGTGVVHMAPGFGEDDQLVCDAAGIRPSSPSTTRARFTARSRRTQGCRCSTPTTPIIRDLKAAGVARARTRPTSTPTRTAGAADTPLIYKAVSSWFVEVTAFRDRMVELNQQITWVPEHIKDGQFGKWLAERPRLVDQPQPLLGLADPGLEVRRPDLPADRRLRLARRARARLRRARSPTCTGRSSTS